MAVTTSLKPILDVLFAISSSLDIALHIRRDDDVDGELFSSCFGAGRPPGAPAMAVWISGVMVAIAAIVRSVLTQVQKTAELVDRTTASVRN